MRRSSARFRTLAALGLYNQVIPNSRGELLTPSIVAFTTQGVIVGEAARHEVRPHMGWPCQLGMTVPGRGGVCSQRACNNQ